MDGLHVIKQGDGAEVMVQGEGTELASCQPACATAHGCLTCVLDLQVRFNIFPEAGKADANCKPSE